MASAALVAGAEVLVLRWASTRGILFAPPPMVGRRNWTSSSSQKQTGQIWYEPRSGAGSWWWPGAFGERVSRMRGRGPGSSGL